MQCTISNPCELRGIGLHSGKECSVVLSPAPENSGRYFLIGDHRISAHFSAIVDSNYCTVLGKGQATIATVEHLLAAAMGLGIDNLLIHVTGEEVPILDGSARPWAAAMIHAGICPQKAARIPLAPANCETIIENGRYMSIAAHTGLRLSVEFDSGSAVAPSSKGDWEINPENFIQELAWARTFGFQRDLPRLLAINRARGAGLDNCIVFADNGLHSDQKFRGTNEPLRHKALDLLGDLALFNNPLAAWIKTKQPGHALTAKALHEWTLKPLDSLEKLR